MADRENQGVGWWNKSGNMNLPLYTLGESEPAPLHKYEKTPHGVNGHAGSQRAET